MNHISALILKKNELIEIALSLIKICLFVFYLIINIII
jgi:hypothetical protein